MPFACSKKLLFGYLTLLCLGACQTPQNPEFREIKNVRIEKLGFKTGKISLDVLMYNPNNFGIELRESDLDIYLDNNYLGHTHQDVQVKVGKKSNFTIPVAADVDVKNLLKNSINLLGSKEVEVTARGTVKIGKAGIFRTFDVNYSGKHTIPKPDIF